MKKQIIKICLLFITTLFLSCSENNNLIPTVTEEVLPPITETGANTFGFKVNDNIYIPKDDTGYTPPGGGTPKGLIVSSGDTNLTDYYSITARNYINFSIYIYIPEDRPQQKKYTFQLSPGVGSTLQDPDFPHLFLIINNKKYLSYENSGIIEFTKVDFTNEVCAGVFSAKLKNIDDENDIIEITDGRFDLICTKPIGD
jgi:hypothetical protein